MDEGISINLSKKTLAAWIGAGLLSVGGSTGTLGTLLSRATDQVEQVQQAVPVMVRGAEACAAELRVTKESLEVCRDVAQKMLDKCIAP